MTLAPLHDAPAVVVVHALAAFAAFALGLAQLAGPKGTTTHRLFGWTWVGLMAIIALSSFGIAGIRQLGPFSLIHVLSIWTLVALPYAVLAARRHRHRAHAFGMVSLFIGALVVAGALTLLPGRLMHDVVFGF